MASFLTRLAEKVAAAAPAAANAPNTSLSSLVAAVQRAAPDPTSTGRAARPQTPIVLVSCSDTKIETHGRLVAAADLYASPLFRKSLAYARAITSEDRIRILSARHGLLRTTDKITSYDFAIQNLSERERDAFGERVHDELGRQFGREPQDLTVLAGAEYVSALRGITNRFRTDRLPWTISLPFGAKKGARMSIGERMQWLNAQALERGATTAAASPRAGAKSLESLTAAVVAAGSPVRAATPAARPPAGVAAPPRTATKSLASLTAAVLAAVPASSTRPVQAATPAARPSSEATAAPQAVAKSLASLPAAVVAAAPASAAPTSARTGLPSVRAGTRISFLGDTANAPSDGAVSSVEGAYFWGRLDNGRILVRQPIALLSTPKWRVLVGAQTPSVRAPGSAAPKSLSAVAATVEIVAQVPSLRAPASLKVDDLDSGWDSPPTQRAPVSATPVRSYLTGDRVRILVGPYAGRTGSISRTPAGTFADRRYVLLDLRPRERTAKTPFLALADLELTGSPAMLASPAASADRGIVTAFREGLDGKQERYSGTTDPQPAPIEALSRILNLGREAETAGELWKSSAQSVRWSQAIRAALSDNGAHAAFHAGHALAVSDWRDRGRALLDELLAVLKRAPEAAPKLQPQELATLEHLARAEDVVPRDEVRGWRTLAEAGLVDEHEGIVGLSKTGREHVAHVFDAERRERHARELAGLADVLTRGGYDPADAARLQAEGMGPDELRERIKELPGALGSLHHTHGLLQRKVPVATSHAPDTAVVDEAWDEPLAPPESPRIDSSRKSFTTNKPERRGHDVPPWNEAWAVHRVGDRIYGDTSFLTAAGQLPRFSVRHQGFGEFALDTPKGEVSFNRSAGVDFPGQTGRSHLLEGKPEALALLLKEMHVEERLSEAASATTAPVEVAKHEVPSVQHPQIDSVAALRRIPVGTKLRLVQSLRGAEDSGRIFHQARSADIAFQIDDPSKKNHGQLSYLQLKGSKIEPRPNGFAVLDAGRLMAAYVFADTAGPTNEARSETPIEGADPTEAEPSLVEVLSPIEHRTAAARRDANIKAMWLAADLEAQPRPLTDEDRLILAAYSDWGGIGLQKSLDKFPPGFDIPDTRQLIHAYFTPPAVCAEIARLVQPLLAGLVATDGRVHALEPAVGIGRFPLALSGRGFETVTWHCVEFSKLSYKMLHALRPDIDLYQGPFEAWVAEHGADFAGRLKLIISNPPYGQRSYATTEDPDRSYRYKRADHYFLRRGLDLLGTGGLGIYIIPSGFLTGMTEDAVELRAEVLRSHHLSAAFRLPNEVFSLANVVTDILFFRARGGSLAEVDEADKFIIEGRYYDELPTHILGTVVPNEPGKRGWHTSAEGYTVTGEFTALPPALDERPMCSACLHTPAPDTAPPPNAAPGTTTKASAAEKIIDNDDRMATVSALGHRVESFLASVANPDLEPVGWEELHHDLTQWATVNGAPAQDKAVLALAKAERGPLGKGPPGGAGWLLKAFLGKSSTLIASLAEKPRWTPRFLGNPNDPLQVGEHLYRSRKTLTIDELPGKDPSALFAAGWCEDSTSSAWTERLDVRGQLLPPDEYLFGELWPRFDRAQARAALGDAQAAAQAARLIEIIKPATFDEIEVTPQDGFVPIELLAAWLTTMNHRDPVELVREKGLVHLANVAYEDHDKSLRSLSTEALLILGWVNHDYVVFQPHAAEGEKVDDVRLALAKDWTQRFRAWLDADPARQRDIEHHYQRARQGYRAHGYGAEPLKLARWNPAIVLNPHQIAGARRIDANRGGGLGFDVGVGKTFTITASLALARQAGRARRAVIVVPQPIAFQWVANLAKSLPDFRVVVIGINKKTIAHGLRKGIETSETDSPEERSRKWARFQGGEFDVAILTYDALPRTQMDKESTLRFIEGVTAIEREVELRRRNAAKASKGTLKKYEEEKGKLERKLEKAVAAEELKRHWPSARSKGDPAQLRAQLEALEKKHLGSLSERQDAVLTEGVGAWLAEMLELPASWKHDPDIVWNTIGVDWMAFDEGHNGKNLHMPSSREGGSVPKFMGNEGEGSKRAWHWFFRCCDVQSRGGEVIVATATPASNSPVEFYNLVKLMDKEAWSRIGIHDPEAFIDRFCLLEPQEVLNAEMEAETRLACVGFKNLDELRSVIFKFWEFKTAKQAKLKLPVAKVDRVFVNMDAAQEKKYESYIAEIETALSNPREGSHKILGLLAKMAMVAMHSQLDEKFGWKDAGLVSSPHSPKFDALAQKILAQRGCGHIVFADYIAAHAWIRDVLIEAGIPAGRIGILNAVVAPAAADRQRIARDFNGDAQAGIASKYDVLIANAIGEEGVDLQDKTCAIHHMDIGWTPKKTEQRNGRGVRQGNTLSNINIFYYIANRSQDGTRLDMVRGKQNWISSLLEGEDKDTNNPAAQSTLSRKELLVLISRDPEKTRLRLEAAEAEREEQRKVKVAKTASDSLRAVANRFERARTERDPTIAAEYLSVARQKLAGLAKVPPDIWPWAGWAVAAEQSPMLVPKEGGPVFEGLRVAMPRVLDHSVIEYAEFGRIDGATLGTRVAGAAHWEAIALDQVVQLHLEPQMRIAEGSGPSWPTDDKAGVDKAMEEKWLHRFRHGAGAADAWKALGWTRAPDRFVREHWSRWGEEIVRAMASTGGWAADLEVPAIRGNQLVLGLTPPFSAVIPPTVAGWQRFLELAPMSGEKFTVLESAGLWWFGRGIPRNLLVAEAAPRSVAA